MKQNKTIRLTDGDVGIFYYQISWRLGCSSRSEKIFNTSG